MSITLMIVKQVCEYQSYYLQAHGQNNFWIVANWLEESLQNFRHLSWIETEKVMRKIHRRTHLEQKNIWNYRVASLQNHILLKRDVINLVKFLKENH